jgi:hypothetical protein
MGEISETPELRKLYRVHLFEPRIHQLCTLVKRAHARGEVRGGIASDIACTKIAGPLFLYYLAVLTGVDTNLPVDLLDQMTKAMLGAIAK